MPAFQFLHGLDDAGRADLEKRARVNNYCRAKLLFVIEAMGGPKASEVLDKERKDRLAKAPNQSTPQGK